MQDYCRSCRRDLSLTGTEKERVIKCTWLEPRTTQDLDQVVWLVAKNELAMFSGTHTATGNSSNHMTWGHCAATSYCRLAILQFVLSCLLDELMVLISFSENSLVDNLTKVCVKKKKQNNLTVGQITVTLIGFAFQDFLFFFDLWLITYKRMKTHDKLSLKTIIFKARDLHLYY